MARIRELFEKDLQRRHHYTLFCTDQSAVNPTAHIREERRQLTRKRSGDVQYVGTHQSIEFRRFDERDLETALGPVTERGGVVAYVCGPPPMTDWAVGVLQRSQGMDANRVLCEKWW